MFPFFCLFLNGDGEIRSQIFTVYARAAFYRQAAYFLTQGLKFPRNTALFILRRKNNIGIRKKHGKAFEKLGYKSYVMKHTLVAFSALLLAGTGSVSAQSTSSSSSGPKAALIVKGGLNLSNITIDKSGSIDNNKTLASFHAGLMADLPISRYFSIQPGAIFTGKGAKLESGNTSSNTWYRSTTRPYYIEVPVNAVIKLPIGDQSSFFFGAGPYVGIGVGGKNRTEGQVLGVNFSRTDNIKFSNDDPFTSQEEGSGYGIMRRFDYGLNGTVGVESKFALFSVNYGLGLAKLQSGTSSSADELNKYRVLSFSVGFKL